MKLFRFITVIKKSTMPKSSKTLSQQLPSLKSSSEKKNKSEEKAKMVLLAQNHQEPIEKEKTEQYDPILEKRKRRFLHAREYAIIEASKRYEKELEEDGQILDHFCSDCFEMVCDCDTCPECDGTGPTRPSKKCMRCHPNYSDFDSEELGEEIAKMLDKDPFFDEDSEQDCESEGESDFE